MDIHIDILSAINTLVGISYNECEEIIDDKIVHARHVSIGFLLFTITFVFY